MVKREASKYPGNFGVSFTSSLCCYGGGGPVQRNVTECELAFEVKLINAGWHAENFESAFTRQEKWLTKGARE